MLELKTQLHWSENKTKTIALSRYNLMCLHPLVTFIRYCRESWSTYERASTQTLRIRAASRVEDRRRILWTQACHIKWPSQGTYPWSRCPTHWTSTLITTRRGVSLRVHQTPPHPLSSLKRNCSVTVAHLLMVCHQEIPLEKTNLQLTRRYCLDFPHRRWQSKNITLQSWKSASKTRSSLMWQRRLEQPKLMVSLYKEVATITFTWLKIMLNQVVILKR